jgi:hypothetical protein
MQSIEIKQVDASAWTPFGPAKNGRFARSVV